MIKIEGKSHLTIKEYAKQMGITQQTVYNWIKQKKLPTRTLMGKTLIEL